MSNKKSLFFVKISLVIMLFFAVFGCANQVRPQGGPKDVTPPVLLKATPANNTRHFNAKTIRLDFDEFFKLSNQYTEISMSPTPEKQPEFKIKQKSLVINLKDTLEKNTTYVINFGKAIVDVNEGNVLKNFTYVFSTGEHIDSLSISGNVLNTLTQQKEKDVTVMLFPLNKDSVFFGKKKPTIYTSTDTSGNFSLNNLHDGDYTIYALKETAPNKIFDRDDELIAFLKQPIHLYTDTSGIQLSLFKQDPEKYHISENKFDVDGSLFFVFNKRFNNPSAKIIYPPALDGSKVVEFTPTKDTARIYMRNMNFDSLRIAFADNGKPTDSISKMKGRKEEFKSPVTFKVNIGISNKLKPTSDLLLTTSTAIDTFDPTLVTLYEDSVAVSNLNITRDTSSLKLFRIKYRWKPESKYILSIENNAFTSIIGNKNDKKFYKPFLVDKIENYSNLTLKVTVPDTSKQYIVEIFQDPKTVIQSNVITKNTSLVYKNFATGKYSFRVIYDENKNGRWDSGNVKLRKYPENIWISPTIITLRANWDAEEKLDIPREKIVQ